MAYNVAYKVRILDRGKVMSKLEMLKDKGERTGKTWMIRLGYLLSGKVY